MARFLSGDGEHFYGLGGEPLRLTINAFDQDYSASVANVIEFGSKRGTWSKSQTLGSPPSENSTGEPNGSYPWGDLQGIPVNPITGIGSYEINFL